MNNDNDSNGAGGRSAETRLLCGLSHNAALQRQSGAERCGAQSLSHVVSFSGGACSFWAAARVVERYGPENVTLLFADTRMEDEDLYRFLREAVQYLGVPLTTISDGRTPWEVFSDEGMMGNSRVDLCSRILKRELLAQWHRANCLEMTSTLYVGIDWTEEHRLHRLRLRKPGWRIEAPMCDAPLWDKCKMMTELKKTGIEPPRLYKLGFPHNNCGGFCIKAGQAHFAHLLKVMPDRFAMHEEKEESMRARLGDVSVMKDRRGGKTATLTMRQLRERVESGKSFDREDWGGCGCAIDSESDGLRGGAEQAGSQASDDSTAPPHNARGAGDRREKPTEDSK